VADFEFDVFLSHNGRDKPLVRALKQRLAEAGLKAWLDEDELRPGINWQPLLEAGIRSSKSIAVLIGPDGLGPWEDEEMQGALKLAANDKRSIIPTLLPGCPKQPELPMFLGIRTWVDLRNGYTDAALARLIWGITGQKPDQSTIPADNTQQEPTTPAELWPESPSAQASGAGDCYRQLRDICANGGVPEGEVRKALWMAVKRDRPTSFLEWQLANLARWSAPEYLEVEERFTPLQVNVRVRESAETPAEKQQHPFDTLAEAMTAVFEEHSAPASVIFAPPGGGKSTLLRHYQLDQARQYLSNAQRLVFYVQLRDYRPEKIASDQDPGIDNPAMRWLEAQWRKETRTAPALFAFIRQGSLTLLLDGLNEIPRRSNDEYRARVAEWRELIDEIEQAHPGVRLLFACRPLDYSQRLDLGRHTRLPEIEVQAMEPERIKAFIDKRFPPASAAQIWDQLENHPSLELYSSPYYLNLLLGQIDSNAREIQIPQNRADLFSGMVRERLRRECQKGVARFADPELLSERDRTLLMSGKPREHWLPDDKPLFGALAALAFHIQDTSGSNERWGSLRWKQARKAMQAALEHKADTDSLLHAGCDLGLFEDDAAQADEIRFIHQQMQEYFAAWVLAEQGAADKLKVPWKSTDLSESTAALLAQGGDDDLPELDNTGWEESALIAANLSEAPESFIRSLIPANLALAGRCAAQPGLSISDELRRELQRELLARSQDPQADLRARIAAGKALGELGDPRLQAHPVRTGIEVFLPGFAPIAGGVYRIGGDSEGFQSEHPAQQVNLDPFELALQPVTNAEFACFVQDGGYRDDAWWPGRALAWRNGEIGLEATQQQVRKNRQNILNDLGAAASAEAIRDRYKLSLASAKSWQAHISAGEADFEAWLLEAYSPPSGPFSKPAYWRLTTWGNPAQPLVGVCWYEAQAYCLWLNGKLDRADYRLPSEAEWEAAGRGRGEWRRYAWPGAFDPLRANTAETRLGVTTPVGVFPGGATPDTGLLDLCGNVWEWTATPWSEGEAWAPALGAGEGSADGRRVVRGGSWDGSRGFARLGFRGHYVPVLRYFNLGFRVCRSSPI
jgi:formylglycine-generating enzyme required for sulfatase activity